VVNSREEAQIVLGTRHIQGIKKWPSVAKFTFFADHFDAGKSVEQISELTGINKSVISTSLKNHYFLQYILSLDCWTDVEKQNTINYSELHKKGVDRILRLFRTKGNEELQILYDDRYRPISELPDFGKIVEHVVRRVFNILPDKDQISTRTSFQDIREDIGQWLPGFTAPKPDTGKAETTKTGITDGVVTSNVKPRTPPKQEFYLENLSYKLDPTKQEDKTLICICEEIKKISRGGGYRQFPLATSHLTRCLIEQTLKRHLRNQDPNEYHRLIDTRDSSLRKILKHYCDNKNLITDNNVRRLLRGLFPDGNGIKDLMDLNIHQPNLSMPTGTVLEGWVSSGLKTLLEYFLN
jgi:hypothetical protein